MQTAPQEAEQELEFGSQPLYFVGQPMSCWGFVEVQNRSAQRVGLRGIPIAVSGLKNTASLPLTKIDLVARLLPGESLRTCLCLSLHPQTPPGRYPAEVLVGNKRRKTTIEILETWDLAILPSAFSIKGLRGERIVRTVWLTNRGNMPFRMPDALFAPLSEKDGVHRSIFQSLKVAGKKGHSEVLDDFVARMQETEVDSATVRITSSRELLEPGETRTVTLEISLPKELRKHRQYVGSVSFENAEITLNIEVFENSPSKSKSRK